MKSIRNLKISLVPLPHADPQRLQELEALMNDVRLFEQLLYRLCERRMKLKMTLLKGEDRIAIEVSWDRLLRRSESDSSSDPHIAILYIPYRELVKVYRPLKIPSRLLFPESRELERWFESRDVRLRVRPDKWCHEAMIAPASLPALLLEYLSHDGITIIEVKRELLGVQAGVRGHVQVCATLVDLRGRSELRETIWVDLKRLGRLVAGRAEKCRPRISADDACTSVVQ